MRITIFCDQAAIARISLPRMFEAVRFRFGSDTELAVATDAVVEGQLNDAGVSWVAGLARPADAWIVALGSIPIHEDTRGWSAVQMPGSTKERAGKQLYILEPHGLIHPIEATESGGFESRMGSASEPYLDEHVFVRLSPRSFRQTAYMFPYNGYYEALASAFGPITSFGFRIAEDLHELQRRSEDRFVMAVFGGSSTLSPACLQNETFSSCLASMLEQHFCTHGGRFKTASVLNFGNSGATVLNELITYLLFVQLQSPHVVVAHDIFNDFAHGLRTDPVLLSKYQITYLPEMERWAQMLMGTSNVPLSQQGDPNLPFVVRTGPQAIVKAYLARKRQFMEIVERSGTVFVYGIQPAWFGKRLTPRETKKMAEIRRVDQHSAPLYEHMERLYSMAHDHLRRDPPQFLVDVHEEFARFGLDEELFVDHAHLNPAGDRRVAEIYFRRIVDEVLPALEKAPLQRGKLS